MASNRVCFSLFGVNLEGNSGFPFYMLDIHFHHWLKFISFGTCLTTRTVILILTGWWRIMPGGDLLIFHPRWQHLSSDVFWANQTYSRQPCLTYIIKLFQPFLFSLSVPVFIYLFVYFFLYIFIRLFMHSFFMTRHLITNFFCECSRLSGSSFWKNLKSRNVLKFTNHLGNHCLFHA